MLVTYIVEYIPMPSRNAKLSPGDVAALAKGVGEKGERVHVTLQKPEQNFGWLEYKVQDRISRKRTVKSKIIQGFINMLRPNFYFKSLLKV